MIGRRLPASSSFVLAQRPDGRLRPAGAPALTPDRATAQIGSDEESHNNSHPTPRPPRATGHRVRSPRPLTARAPMGASMNSGRSTFSHGTAGTGPRSAASTKNPAARHGAGCAPPTPAPRACATCSPLTTWAKTSCMGTSSRVRPGPGSWNSAATCALYSPPDVRIAIICDNFSPHLTTRKDKRVGQWAAANNVEIAYTLTNASWLNRVPVNRTAVLRPRRHRPRKPPRAGQHDPPLHHLAQQPRLRRTATAHRRPGKRSLMRH
jgi:hypothetical protein